MASPRIPSPSVPMLQQQVCRIISQRKKIRATRLRLLTNLHQELGFDTLDLVDIILAVERRFHVNIPTKCRCAP